MLIYVTGTSGSGKTTLTQELCARRYDARDSDRSISGWRRLSDCAEVITTAPELHHDERWRAEHVWSFYPGRVERFAVEIADGVGFMLGSADGERAVWHLFERVFYLDLDADTLRERLLTRTNNAFGKAPQELQAILGWHVGAAERYRGYGATILDASAPVTALADALLNACALPLAVPMDSR